MNTNDVIIRISGHGQFKVNSEVLDKINEIDNSIVDLIENISLGQSDNKLAQKELQSKLTEMKNLITSKGRPIDDKEIVKSDVIVPESDLSIEEAKKIFKEEGLISDD
jgi:PspA-Associated protein